MTNTFNDVDVAALLRIAGEVGELEHEAHVRRAHILERLLALLGGCSAVCSEMDPKHSHTTGWALPNSVTCAGGLTKSDQSLIDRYVTGHVAALDPAVPPMLRIDRPAVTVRRMDVVDRSWFRSDHYNEVRRPLGFGEALYAKFVTPDGRLLKLSFHRELSDDPYNERHVQLLHIFNQNLAGLYVVAPNKRLCTAPQRCTQQDDRVTNLPPRLRPVLRHLLGGDSEKQVALKLTLSPHTIHEYVKELYRKFGVNSRGELLAQFVSASPVWEQLGDSMPRQYQH